jgi:hypothetical protein
VAKKMPRRVSVFFREPEMKDESGIIHLPVVGIGSWPEVGGALARDLLSLGA